MGLCSTDSGCLWYRSAIISYGLQTYGDTELIKNNALLVSYVGCYFEIGLSIMVNLLIYTLSHLENDRDVSAYTR